jgi:predicted nucleic acid-binding protein
VIAPYLDASAIIYLVEGAAGARALVAARIAGAERDPSGRLLTSRLSRLECRVKPLRAADAALLVTYDAFFARGRLVVVDVTGPVIDRATELRVKYGFKTPDALHLASAILGGADVFVTGDVALGRCTEVKVEIVSPVAPPP